MKARRARAFVFLGPERMTALSLADASDAYGYHSRHDRHQPKTSTKAGELPIRLCGKRIHGPNFADSPRMLS
jgi:hypothetical protein